MKRFIEADNGRMFKLEGLMFASEIKEKYPAFLTADTKFDEEGKPLPIFYFNMMYDNNVSVTPEYDDIEEAVQDREKLLKELNEE